MTLALPKQKEKWGKSIACLTIISGRGIFFFGILAWEDLDLVVEINVWELRELFRVLCKAAVTVHNNYGNVSMRLWDIFSKVTILAECTTLDWHA